MHACGKSLLLGDATQHGREAGTLLVGEAGEQIGVVFPGDLGDGLEGSFALAGEIELVESPVGCGGSSFDPSSLLEVVKYSDEAAGVHMQMLCHLLLGEPGRDREQTEDSGVVRGKAMWFESFSEAHGGVRAYLRNEKAC
jgi:hypothetical protein